MFASLTRMFLVRSSRWYPTPADSTETTLPLTGCCVTPAGDIHPLFSLETYIVACTVFSFFLLFSLFYHRWEWFRKLGALLLNGKTLLQLIVLHSDAAKKMFCSDLNYDSLRGLEAQAAFKWQHRGGKIHIVSKQQRRIRRHLQPSAKWLRCPFKAKHTIVSLTIHNLTQEVTHRTQIQWPARLRLRDNRTAAPLSSGKMFLCALWSGRAHTNTQTHWIQMWRRAHRYCTTRSCISNLQRQAKIKTHACTIFHSWVMAFRVSTPWWFKSAVIKIWGAVRKLKTGGFGAGPNSGPLLKTLDISLWPTFLLNSELIRLTS